MKKYIKAFCIMMAMTFIVTVNYAKASDNTAAATGVIPGVSEAVGGFDMDNAPELTETELTLKIGESYDLDVNNKITDSKYKYESIGKNVASVSPYKGIVKAKTKGVTTVYCTITLPDSKIGVLKCKITVTK